MIVATPTLTKGSSAIALKTRAEETRTARIYDHEQPRVHVLNNSLESLPTSHTTVRRRAMFALQTSLSNCLLPGGEECCGKWEGREEQQENESHDQVWDCLDLHIIVRHKNRNAIAYQSTYEKEELPASENRGMRADKTESQKTTDCARESTRHAQADPECKLTPVEGAFNTSYASSHSDPRTWCTRTRGSISFLRSIPRCSELKVHNPAA